MNEKPDYLTVQQAADRIPSKPAYITVWRWMRSGVRSRSGRKVRLAHVRFGGKLFTTQADVDRFSRELADADLEHLCPQPNHLPKVAESREEIRRARDLDAARRRLRTSGIG
jgi:hypothetical protein